MPAELEEGVSGDHGSNGGYDGIRGGSGRCWHRGSRCRRLLLILRGRGGEVSGRLHCCSLLNAILIGRIIPCVPSPNSLLWPTVIEVLSFTYRIGRERKQEKWLRINNCVVGGSQTLTAGEH